MKIRNVNIAGVKVCGSVYLVRLMDTLLKNSDKPGHISSVVITDFSKAFDLVDHNLLMNTECAHQSLHGLQTFFITENSALGIRYTIADGKH